MKDKVAIIGGGISGLTCAFELAKKDYNVHLIEASDRLGGLAAAFNNNGIWVDKFYHCIMPSDDFLLGLIDEINLTNLLYWKKTLMGFIVNGKTYSFNNALDLLKFRPLNLTKRIWFGVVSLFLRQLGKKKDLDNLSIKEWFVKIYGKEIWEIIFRPLFNSKFGTQADTIPSLYIWERLGREKNVSTRGYLKCGYKGLIDGIENRIKNLKGKIYLNSRINQIRKTDKTFELYSNERVFKSDWVISTIPIPVLKGILSDDLEVYRDKLPKIKYQGVINALFFLKKPLDRNYWCPVVNSNTEFDGIVGMSNLVNIEQLYGNHLVYTMKYVDKVDPIFREDENIIKARWSAQLISLYRDMPLTKEDIIDVKIFKAPFVEPIYTLGHSKIKPTIRTNNEKLLLSTTSQIYPNITCCNSSVKLAKEVVRCLSR